MKSILKISLLRFALLSLIVAIGFGCANPYGVAITIVEAEDAAMKEWATLHNDHKTTPDIDRKVMNAHSRFNQAKLIAANALRDYKNGGDKARYVIALEAARNAIDPIINLLQPLLIPGKVENLRLKAAHASTLE